MIKQKNSTLRAFLEIDELIIFLLLVVCVLCFVGACCAPSKSDEKAATPAPQVQTVTPEAPAPVAPPATPAPKAPVAPSTVTIYEISFYLPDGEVKTWEVQDSSYERDGNSILFYPIGSKKAVRLVGSFSVIVK